MRSAIGEGMVKPDERCCSGIHTRVFICGDLRNCINGGRFPHRDSGVDATDDARRPGADAATSLELFTGSCSAGRPWSL
jgi:hypothetical protein